MVFLVLFLLLFDIGLSALWDAWLCGLESNIHFGKCAFIIAELLLLPLAFSFWHPLTCMLHSHGSTVLGLLGFYSPAHVFSLSIGSGSVDFHILDLRNAHTQFTKEPTKCILHSVTVTLTLGFSYNFLMEFLSLWLHYPSFITCLFFTLKPLA